MEKLQQLFSFEAEQLNGRVAMVFFTVAVATELLTGLGPVNQVLSVFGMHL